MEVLFNVKRLLIFEQHKKLFRCIVSITLLKNRRPFTIKSHGDEIYTKVVYLLIKCVSVVR